MCSSDLMTFDNRVRFNWLDLTRNPTRPGQRDFPAGGADRVPVPVRWLVIGVLHRFACNVRITSQEGWPKNTSVQTM